MNIHFFVHNIRMQKMNEILDKTYVLYVLDTMNWTAYQLAKQSGVSNETLSRAKAFKASLSWQTITKIENATNIEFRSSGHVLFSAQFLENPELNETDININPNKKSKLN